MSIPLWGKNKPNSLINSHKKAYEKFKRNKTMNFLKLKSTKSTPSFISYSPIRIQRSDEANPGSHIPRKRQIQRINDKLT